MDRLITRNELASRLSCAKNLVYRHTRVGGKLHGAMVGGLVDLSHGSLQAFCDKHNYKEPDAVLRAAAVTAGAEKLAAHNQRQRAEGRARADDDDEHDALGELDGVDERTSSAEFQAMTVREVVDRYGTSSRFREVTAAVKNLVQMRGYEDEQARKRGEYVHRVLAERLVAMVDGQQRALLSDAVANMASTAMVMSRSGSTQREIERAMRNVISRIIKMTKSEMARALREG